MVVIVRWLAVLGLRFFCSGTIFGTHGANSTVPAGPHAAPGGSLWHQLSGISPIPSHLFHLDPPALHYDEEASLAILRLRAPIGEA